MNGKPFTEFEDNQLRKLHEGGATVLHMSQVLDRPYGSICTRRQHLGLSYRNGPAKQVDADCDEFETEAYDILPRLVIGTLATVGFVLWSVAFGLYLGVM